MRGKKPEQRLNHAQRRALNRQAVQDPPLPYAFIMWSYPMLDGVQKYVEKLITIGGPDYAYRTKRSSVNRVVARRKDWNGGLRRSGSSTTSQS